MTEYIERDALIEHIKDLPTWWADGGGVYEGINMKYPDGMFDCDDVVSSIENAPAADVVPVVHGRWLGKPGLFQGKCSICGYMTYDKTADWVRAYWPYCPNCGNPMDGGGENG